MPKSAALVKVDFDVVAESTFEVELVHGDTSLVGCAVGHLGLAKVDRLSQVIGAYLEAAALQSAILGADSPQLILRDLFKYYVQINYHS